VLIHNQSYTFSTKNYKPNSEIERSSHHWIIRTYIIMNQLDVRIKELKIQYNRENKIHSILMGHTDLNFKSAQICFILYELFQSVHCKLLFDCLLNSLQVTKYCSLNFRVYL